MAISAHPLSLVLLLFSTVCGCSGNKNSQHWLDMALEGRTADERRKGVNGLADSRDGGADWAWQVFDTIARTDTDAPVRCAAVRGMEKGARRESVPTLVKLLRGPRQASEDVRPAPPLVRAEAAKALLGILRSGGHTTDQEADIRDTLLDRLTHETDRNVRLPCLEAAAFLPRQELLSPLIDALDENDFALRRAAAQSLEALTGVSYGYDGPAWRNWLATCGNPFANRALTASSTGADRRWWAWWD